MSKGTRKDRLVTAPWKGEQAGGEALTSAGVPVIPVVSQGAERSTRARVGQNQAGLAGGAGQGTIASAALTGRVAPCRDSKKQGFCSRKSRSQGKFHRLQQKHSQRLRAGMPSTKSSC